MELNRNETSLVTSNARLLDCSFKGSVWITKGFEGFGFWTSSLWSLKKTFPLLLLMPKMLSMIMAINSPSSRPWPCWDHLSADNAAEDEPWCEKPLGECDTVAETQERGCQKGSWLWCHSEPPILKGAISKMAKKLWSGNHKKEEEFNQKKEHGRRSSVGQFSQFWGRYYI